MSGRPHRKASPGCREEQLADLIDDQDVEAALTALRRGMGATCSIRVPATSAKQLVEAQTRRGGYAYEVVPDFSTQIAAAKILLEFKFGRAAQTNLLQLGNSPDVGQDFSREEFVATLAAMEGDLSGIARTYIEGLSRVGPLPPGPAKKPAEPQIVEMPSRLHIALLDD